MPKNGFINFGKGSTTGSSDGNEVKNGYAYIYDTDGSGFSGILSAIQPIDGYSLQIKAKPDGSKIIFRTLSTGGWSEWREFQLK